MHDGVVECAMGLKLKVLNWQPVTMEFNAASMRSNAQMHMPDQRARAQRCKTPSKSGLANRNQEINAEFRGFRLLKKQHHPHEK